MILESAQLLCTAHRVLDGVKTSLNVPGKLRSVSRYVLPYPALETALYTATHVQHPCAIWVRESKANYMWLYELMLCLNAEFVRRYNKREDHLTIRKLKELLKNPPQNIPDGEFSNPPACMPEQFKVADTVLSYRNYYNGAKADISKWTNTPIPRWFTVK